MKKAKHRPLHAAAADVGIAPITLRRWLIEGKVREVARDRNGWRVFTDADVKRIKKFARRVVRPKER